MKLLKNIFMLLVINNDLTIIKCVCNKIYNLNKTQNYNTGPKKFVVSKSWA